MEPASHLFSWPAPGSGVVCYGRHSRRSGTRVIAAIPVEGVSDPFAVRRGFTFAEGPHVLAGIHDKRPLEACACAASFRPFLAIYREPPTREAYRTPTLRTRVNKHRGHPPLRLCRFVVRVLRRHPSFPTRNGA
jgi:hypothetical protein